MAKPIDTSETSIEGFQYPPSGLPVHANWLNIASVDNTSGTATPSSSQAAESGGELSARQSVKAFEKGRMEGIEEGRNIERLEQAKRIEQFRNQKIEMAARLNEEFARERDNFLSAVEPEIVKLALRVAERILRRELQVDPLILTGSIRIALSQLADKTAVRIHVPAIDAELWNETLCHLPNLRVRPAIVADQELRQGDCQLESDLGSADLSIGSQLREIARGLLGQTGAKSKPTTDKDTAETRV